MGGSAASGGQTPLLTEVLNELADLTESVEVQEWPVVMVVRLCGRLLRSIVSPAQGNRCVRASGKADDEVWIETPAHADDFTSLTMQGVVGMDDGHVFQRQVGKRGSVLWGCRPLQTGHDRRSISRHCSR